MIQLRASELERDRRPYPYTEHPQVQKSMMARMQANLDYSVQLSLSTRCRPTGHVRYNPSSDSELA
jgi:hypothetical protein